MGYRALVLVLVLVLFKQESGCSIFGGKGFTEHSESYIKRSTYMLPWIFLPACLLMPPTLGEKDVWCSITIRLLST